MVFGLGTLINTLSVVIGGIFGLLFGKHIKEGMKDSLVMACGIATLFIGISGTIANMFSVNGTSITVVGSMLIILSLVLGALIGELLNIESWVERFGNFLKRKTKSENDNRFTMGFLDASLTVCIGAMAVVGSIQDGTTGDFTTLALKSILDFIIVMVMTASMGKGCIFSALPIFILEGGMTLLAYFFHSFVGDKTLQYLSIVGNVLIFCVGINLVWGKKVKVANFLPALLFAIIASFLPFSL